MRLVALVELPLLLDMIAFGAFVLFSVGYHAVYAYAARHKLAWSVRARMHEHRQNWVELVLKRGERIMAVQTLRNQIMTNTFAASTMILLVAFIVNFVVLGQPEKAFNLPDEPAFWQGVTPIRVKGLILLLLYAFAFVMFMTSLRTLNHLSILIGVDPDHLRAIEQTDPAKFLAARLNEAESLTTYGRRAVYYSLPVIGWFFSPWIFMLLTVLSWTYFVLFMDVARKVPEPKKEPLKEAQAASPPPLPATK